MYESKNVIDIDSVNLAMNSLNIDELGLDKTDRKVLECLIIRYGGKPVGLSAIASATSESIDNIQDVYEPYLVQLGMINRTPKGRVPTKLAYNHLNIPYQD